MSRYLVTFTETYEVEADDSREAESVADELRDIAFPTSTDVSVEIIEGVTP